MTTTTDVPSLRAAMTPGTRAALVVVLTGALCLALEPIWPWVVKWPDAWTLPATQWVDTVTRWLLAWLKPLARAFANLMRYPMDWANAGLNATPWPATIGIVTAIGWYLGGVRMAALGFIGLCFVLASGYWSQSMNTLALVAVSVPLALIVGGAIGVLANEFPRLKAPVQVVLDVMQTVPTFAYLTPLLVLFGFGPVVGLIASAIYAAPPMARNVILGLERVESEIKEAAVMSGAGRLQQLFQVEIPSAAAQIMVGVNQCLMAALSMVIIAAVIGGFNDIGWEVLLTMRKAQFGQSLLAGLVIVVFAVVIDRMSGALAIERRRHDARVVYGVLALAAVLTALFWSSLPDPAEFTLLVPVADWVDGGLGDFTATNGDWLAGIKNNAMFYVLLPLRIGLDQAVLPFTWGFAWTPAMSWGVFAAGAALCLALIWRGRMTAGLIALIGAGMLETGIADLPWPFVLVGAAALGRIAGGWRLSVLAVGLLLTILLSGLWERALLSLYLSGAAVFACAVVGGLFGRWPGASCGRSATCCKRSRSSCS